MDIVIVGAGPVGSFLALVLSRRGHQVQLVDRDPGPPEGAEWVRKGVMQHSLPHGFRPQVRQLFDQLVPELVPALQLAGVVRVAPEGWPDELAGLESRRATFERALWTFTTAEPGVRRVTGHADRLICAEDGRISGVVVDGRELPADLVVVATGRAGHLGDELRAPAEGGDCGYSYAAREYQAKPGVRTPSWGHPLFETFDGYYGAVFAQDRGTMQLLIVRPSTDTALAALRHGELFQQVVQSIPMFAPYVDPDRFDPMGPVRVGANLLNVYRGQRSAEGDVRPGVVFVGDAVCTTNPALGRGLVLGLRQAEQLLALLERSTDLAGVASDFDDWCAEHIRPWWSDHVYWDALSLRRFAGEDVDLDAPIPSDVVRACVARDPSMMAAVGPYMGMLALPGILDTVQDKARAVLATGWRPPIANGPTRDQIVEMAESVLVG